jgi:hypothetical protein
VKPIGMIAIPIEKGVLMVEASRISHMVVDNHTENVKLIVHLESGEEFTVGDAEAIDILDEYNSLVEAASGK